MVFGDHQVWSSPGVLLRVTVIVGTAWLVVGLVWWSTKGQKATNSPLARVSGAIGLAGLGTASIVAYLPINVRSGYLHCGTALVTEARHSCEAADYSGHRSAVVALLAVALIGLTTRLVVSRRGEPEDQRTPRLTARNH